MSLINNIETLEEEKKAKLPKKLYIGFEKGISKSDHKDVLSYIHAYAEENFSTKKNAYYNIVKIKDSDVLPDGHLFEIQEGGNKESYLQGIFKKLEEQDEIIIETAEKQLFIQKGFDNINSYYLTEDAQKDPDEIETDFNLTPLVKQGHVFMFTGIVIFALSVISLFLAALFKYVLFNSSEKYVEETDKNVIPVQRIIQRWQSNFEFQTVSLQFNNKTKGWEIHKKHYNYKKSDKGDFYEEGEVKYSIDKIDNTNKLQNTISNNEEKRKKAQKDN
tara:strand:+ start:1919 stop:2743 length:825 start_codon:yes stop_codon:yes gene_type:complete